MRVRANWQTRLGFYFAAIGSAFGLGNLWRFPYVVAENGGGAFVLLYVFLAFMIGVPILIAELILGKTTQQSILGALQETLKNNKMKPVFRKLLPWLGRMAVFASLIVLSYYAVISGWVLHYFMQFFIGLFRAEGFEASQALLTLKESGGMQVALASVHLLATIFVVMKGVQNGIERWVGFLMPVFALLLITLVIKSLSLPTATTALRFLFYPDFSKLTINALAQALGHVLFTLSIGFGIMVTFGSYLRHDSYIPDTGFRVALVDTMISLFAGLLIFPILMASALPEGGPEVLFQTLPVLFEKFSGGHLFGLAFFLCLYLATLGASIGLLEVIVSNLGDRWGVTRFRAVWLIGGLALLAAIPPALSSSALSEVKWAGMSVLEVVDALLINWLLPLIALGLCWVVSFWVKSEAKEKEFLGAQYSESVALFGNWKFVLRWVAPVVIIFALVLETWSLFKS